MDQRVAYLQVLEVTSCVVLFAKRWSWHEDARAEGLRSLVHSFSQFAREIDGGHIRAAHFGLPALPKTTMAASTRRTSTSLRQSLLQSRSSTYGSTPYASPHSSTGSFHSVSPTPSGGLASPLYATSPGHLGPSSPAPMRLHMASTENILFQVVLFYAWTSSDPDGREMDALAGALLEKFTALFAQSPAWEKAKGLLKSVVDKDENGAISHHFETFHDVVTDLIEIQTAQV
ncbi:hypothetical protein SPRG_03346 [Saprolegnia parasitica CBS 223.65]|uniref:Uncharacterized protein n=1 Tax=Saprolegnia parasitica (strain CBS 223.65) TaxID=695850 RepID=A0A067CN56_SAPPC|nr:hypothetical protein SPRG_03346 [Saprolegnia parasitica CBS 223.65]KDO32129.1 hypothetical protein SPRG_03346 [Saprolegnia parasitica CBS 223.65]|eukprot:XP_012197313.1 hypothetical protein SPRG_03346 [Saprolegnia parasitica CBS 223.65]